jgi:hypothetical protein
MSQSTLGNLDGTGFTRQFAEARWWHAGVGAFLIIAGMWAGHLSSQAFPNSFTPSDPQVGAVSLGRPFWVPCFWSEVSRS